MAAKVPLDTIAKLLDLTPRRVQQLSAEGVIPRAERGQYELIPAVRGYVRYLRERALGADMGAEQLSSARTRLTRSNADVAEMERAKMAGELVPAAQIKNTWESLVGVMRTRLLSVPAKIAARIGMARNAIEAQEIVRTEVNEALSELSKVDVSIEPEPAADPADEDASDIGEDRGLDAGEPAAPDESHTEPVV